MSSKDVVLRGGRVHDLAGWRNADLVLSDGLVSDGHARAGATMLDVSGCWVAPGFVDVHVHGAGGAWVTGPDGLAVVSATLAQHGVTTFLATTAAAPLPELAATCAAVRDLEALPGARCGGVHLEGPWLAPTRAGAQPAEHFRAIDLDEVKALVDPDVVRVVTIAPELPGALEAIDWLTSSGVTVALGHSDASYDEAVAATERGARHVTHAFNAMRGLHHRDPGLVGAALELAALRTVEVIADGEHVHPGVVRMLWRARGAATVCLVSDGVDGCLHDTDLVRDGTALRRPDGRLAGSALGLDDAVRNLVEWGVPLADVVTMAAVTPSTLLTPNAGGLRIGARADVVVLDAELRVRHTIVGGELVYSAAGDGAAA